MKNNPIHYDKNHQYVVQIKRKRKNCDWKDHGYYKTYEKAAAAIQAIITECNCAYSRIVYRELIEDVIMDTEDPVKRIPI